MTETIVIYHGGCRDGFCAAWVVDLYFQNREYRRGSIDGNIEYYPGFHGQEPPNCKDKHIIIVDFSYDLEMMKRIAIECQTLIILDHHKTAEETLKNLAKILKNNVEVSIQFDNDKSGAGLAWDYFFNNSRPWIVDYVEDRDLWNKKLDLTDQVNSFISCLKFDFDEWSRASALELSNAAEAGKIAIMKTEQYVAEVCKNVYFTYINDRYIAAEWRDIPTVNICQVDCSEVLHELCKLYPNSPFSLYWFKRHDGLYQYGLRSIGDFDVSIVAKQFGGGGHKNAAGFQLNYLLEELK